MDAGSYRKSPSEEPSVLEILEILAVCQKKLQEKVVGSQPKGDQGHREGLPKKVRA